jgi:hypothetical protein
VYLTHILKGPSPVKICSLFLPVVVSSGLPSPKFQVYDGDSYGEIKLKLILHRLFSPNLGTALLQVNEGLEHFTQLGTTTGKQHVK